MHPKYSAYRQASEVFVQQVKTDPEVIGIIVCGGWLEGDIDPNSDIDIHLILDSACNYRERGNTWIDGIEIEYFKNPPQQIRRYFELETASPHTAFMLSQGEIRYQESPIVATLKAEASDNLAKERKPMPGFAIELAKYLLDDHYKDLEDAQAAQDAVGSILIQQKILNVSLDLFYKLQQKYRPKDKRLLASLHHLDPGFAKIIQQSLGVAWNDHQGLQALQTYINQLLGGSRLKEWTLKGPLDL